VRLGDITMMARDLEVDRATGSDKWVIMRRGRIRPLRASVLKRPGERHTIRARAP
jgi:hypothetical protein